MKYKLARLAAFFYHLTHPNRVDTLLFVGDVPVMRLVGQAKNEVTKSTRLYKKHKSIKTNRFGYIYSTDKSLVLKSTTAKTINIKNWRVVQ